MTIKVQGKGEAIDSSQFIQAPVLDLSFRVLTDYVIAFDMYMTRLDVLYHGVQWNVTVVGNPKSGDPNIGVNRDDLISPRHLQNMGQSTASRVNKVQLSEALRALADKLDTLE